MEKKPSNNSHDNDAAEDERPLRDGSVRAPVLTIDQRMEPLDIATDSPRPQASPSPATSFSRHHSRWSHEEQKRRRKYFASKARRLHREKERRAKNAAFIQALMFNAAYILKRCGFPDQGRRSTWRGRGGRDRGGRGRGGRGRGGRGRGECGKRGRGRGGRGRGERSRGVRGRPY